jgi:hypothetical protein
MPPHKKRGSQKLKAIPGCKCKRGRCYTHGYACKTCCPDCPKKILGCRHKMGICPAHRYACKICCPACKEERGPADQAAPAPPPPPPRKRPASTQTPVPRHNQRRRIKDATHHTNPAVAAVLLAEDERFTEDAEGNRKLQLSFASLQEIYSWTDQDPTSRKDYDNRNGRNHII